MAGVGLGTDVEIVAGGPVGRRWVGAEASSWAANPRYMTLVSGRTDHRIRPYTNPGLAGVSLGAGVAIVAGGPIGCRWVCARPQGPVPCTGNVALIDRSANDLFCDGDIHDDLINTA